MCPITVYWLIHKKKNLYIDLYYLHCRNFGPSVAYCDAGAALSEDYISNIRSAASTFFQKDSLNYRTKEYTIELKPLFSAFELRTFGMTTLRSFLLFYLPLLEPRSNMEEDDEDFLQDNQEERRVDLVVPFKKSVKQIVREVCCIDIPCCLFHNGLWFSSSAFKGTHLYACNLFVMGDKFIFILWWGT